MIQIKLLFYVFFIRERLIFDVYQKSTYRCDVGLLGGSAGLLPKPLGVRGVTGKAGVSGLGDKSLSTSDL